MRYHHPSTDKTLAPISNYNTGHNKTYVDLPEFMHITNFDETIIGVTGSRERFWFLTVNSSYSNLFCVQHV